jgi:hypothetical protein
VSADVYCQNINYQKHEQSSYLYETERRGKRARHRRDRERECAREGEQLQNEVASVVKMAIEEVDHLG